MLIFSLQFLQELSPVSKSATCDNQTLRNCQSERTQSYRLVENVHDLRLPWHIVELVNAFPFGEAMHPEIVKPLIVQFLPMHQEALRLSLLYYEHLAWMCVNVVLSSCVC